MQFIPYRILLSLFLVLLCLSCKKEGNQSRQKEVEDIFIKDLNNGTISTGQPTADAAVIYFNFDERRQVLATDTWHIAFTGMANTTILSNAQDGVWLSIQNVDYQNITQRPSITYDLTSLGNANIHARGWFTYNYQTHIVSPVAGRTIFVQTNRDKIYKLQMLSIYFGAPLFPTLNDAAPYLNFRFAELE